MTNIPWNSGPDPGKPDQRWYDFAEELPVWKKWWFRAGVIAAGIGLVIFLWLFL